MHFPLFFNAPSVLMASYHSLNLKENLSIVAEKNLLKLPQDCSSKSLDVLTILIQTGLILDHEPINLGALEI